MEKCGYLDFTVINPTLFTFTDDEGTTRHYEFDPQEPKDTIETVGTLIQQFGLTKVICNKIGYGICGSISQYLKTKYNNNKCLFELNT